VKSKILKATKCSKVELLQKAEVYWVKQVQMTEFAEYIDSLKGDSDDFLPKDLQKLKLFLDKNGLIRVGGRLKFTELEIVKERKSPILLPNNSELVHKIVLGIHQRNLCCSASQTLGILRNKFWLIGGLSKTRKIANKCLRCLKFRLSNVQPVMGPLPKFRVECSFPYQFVGMDFCGPFKVKKDDSKFEFNYILLFTCMTHRGVHLEVTQNLTTEETILAITRFLARKGKPSLIFSDNGTQLVKARQLVKKLKFERIEGFLAREQIEWKLNPPSAPHFGGCFESIVKLVKKPLRVILEKYTPNKDQFLTLVLQAEQIVNSRPLLRVESNFDEVITPSHFWLGRSPMEIIPNLNEAATNNIEKNWKFRNKIAQHFKKEFVKLYLSQLVPLNKWLQTNNKISLGDVVLIREKTISTYKWPMGRVVQIFPGKDGEIRVVKVKTKNVILTRPVNKLCVLVPKSET